MEPALGAFDDEVWTRRVQMRTTVCVNDATNDDDVFVLFALNGLAGK